MTPEEIERFRSLLSRLSEKFAEFTATFNTRLEYIEKMLTSIDHKVSGNGKAGLVTEVDVQKRDIRELTADVNQLREALDSFGGLKERAAVADERWNMSGAISTIVLASVISGAIGLFLK